LHVPVKVVGAVTSYSVLDRLTGRIHRKGLSGVDEEVKIVLVGATDIALSYLSPGYLINHVRVRRGSYLL